MYNSFSSAWVLNSSTEIGLEALLLKLTLYGPGTKSSGNKNPYLVEIIHHEEG